MLQLGKTLYHQGDLSYFEAVNKETLKNAYQHFEEEGIILVSKSRPAPTNTTTETTTPNTNPKPTNAKDNTPLLRLSEDWTPLRDPQTGAIVPSGKLWDFAQMISASRREGKNRRDGATVKTRVIALVELVSQQLRAATAAASEARGGGGGDLGGDGGSEGGKRRKGKRRKIVTVPQARL